MKTNILRYLAVAMFLPFITTAQCPEGYTASPCNLLNHAVFKSAPAQTPVVLKVLGTSPQFGEVPKHTAQSAYAHLQKVYSKNIKNSRAEMDNLFVALGYSGFKDAAFNASQITPEVLPSGKVGWMGAYAKGHKYAWSQLGKDFPGYKIPSKDGSCYVYIMKKCGNVFYVPSCIPAPPPVSLLPKVTCQTQTINISGKGQIQGGDVLNTRKDMQIVAVSGNKKLCLGSYSIPVRATYEYLAKGEIKPLSQTIEVCAQGNTKPADMVLALPLNLSYKITKQDVQMGDATSMVLNVSEDQFKALSKAYKECAVDAAASSSGEDFTKKVNNSTAAASSGTASGDGKCADQKINFTGKTEVQDGSAKVSTESVTLIGTYRKTGKLAKGEVAEKTLCLGTFQVPVKSVYGYTATGETSTSKNVQVCVKNGSVASEQNINLPIDVNYSFTKQDVKVGDDNKVYIQLNESQYKALAKKYNRCCTEGACDD